MRVGIVGYGLAGRVFHARLVTAVPGATVAGVVTRDPGRRAEAAADLPDVACYDTLDDLIAHGDLDLVVVAVANVAHASIALRCIDAGVAVVVDKPLAIDADEARDVVRAATRAGVGLTVFQNRRFDADQLTLRRLMGDGSLGRVLRYESRFERWRPRRTSGKWRDEAPPNQGGGHLLDLGTHLVDQSIALFGPVSTVFAEVDSRRGGGDDDVFVALEHTNGVYAHLWCGAMTAAPGPRLRVNGTLAGFVVDELDGQEAALRAGRPPDEAAPQAMRLVREGDATPVVPEAGAWDSFYPAVFAALRDGTPMPVEATEAVTTLRVLDAARLSAASRRVVDLTGPGPGPARW